MTPQSPAPVAGRPLTAEDVALLKKGDLLRRIDGRISIHGLEYESGLSGTYLDGTTHANSPPSHFTYLGRPDQDGWMPWSGGENPVPGQMVEVKLRSGRPPFSDQSDELIWSGHDLRDAFNSHDIIAFRLSRLASEQPVEASGAGREEEIPERAEGRLAERPWRVGDPLPAVGSVVLVSGVHGDIESDQHRGYLRRTVIGYGKDNAFICLQTEGCWPPFPPHPRRGPRWAGRWRRCGRRWSLSAKAREWLQ